MLLANRPAPVWTETHAWAIGETVELAPQLLAAQVAQVVGEYDEARQRYLDLLQRFPSSVDAWQKYIEFEDGERLPFSHPEQLQRLHDSAATSYEREKTAFALAHYWKTRQPGRAFELASSAHQLKRRRIGGWSSAEKQQQLQADLRWLPQQESPLSSPPRLVFIVGLPRSGTTLLSSILAANPQIANAGEQNLVASLAAGPCRSPGAVDPKLSRFVQAWYRAAVGDISREAAAVVDKLPGNAEQCGLILAMFPDALVIHIERGLADCAISIHLHDFEYGCRYADDPIDLAAYATMLSAHLRHWRSKAPNRVLHLQFEDLLQDPQRALEPVMIALGLAWDPGMLSFWKQKEIIGTYSEKQIRRPLNQDGVATWHRYLPQAEGFYRALGH
ncbi:sulfotransferase [Pseudoxanthomonas sp. UTMC 1351]|uniref:sulfotransferase n=1 Tax=Pseudoxanthomonas sp. UTMC 1351 TaxID=2695853 RepID=UPI0034CE0C3E